MSIPLAILFVIGVGSVSAICIVGGAICWASTNGMSFIGSCYRKIRPVAKPAPYLDQSVALGLRTQYTEWKK